MLAILDRISNLIIDSRLFQRSLSKILKHYREIHGNVEIGRNVSIGAQTTIYAKNRITIGDGVQIAPYCYIIDFDHKIDGNKNRAEVTPSAPIKIGNNVWIGAHCIILKGVTIGNGSVVGAGSVVTKDIPPKEVWGGNPARKIRGI